MNNTNKIKVFVVSSIEGEVANEFVRNVLKNNDIDAVDWKNSFPAGQYALDSLMEATKNVHGAVIISTCDDKIWYRGNDAKAPRDNVLFEMGLFTNALGIKKVPLIFVQNVNGDYPKRPTDINGLNTIKFKNNDDKHNTEELKKWIDEFKKNSHHTSRVLLDSLEMCLSKISNSWINEVMKHLTSIFKEMSEGVLWLNTIDYYDSVYNRLGAVNNRSKIRAVSFISPDIWRDDPQQRRFFEFNVTARDRGASIQRLFVINNEQIDTYSTVIQEHAEKRFMVKTMRPNDFSRFFREANDELYDMIMFDTPKMCCYKTNKHYGDDNKVGGATLIVNEEKCKSQMELFDKIWNLAEEPGTETLSCRA